MLAFNLFVMTLWMFCRSQDIDDYVQIIRSDYDPQLNGLFGQIKSITNGVLCDVKIPSMIPTQLIHKRNLRVVCTFWISNKISRKKEQWYLLKPFMPTIMKTDRFAWHIVQKENGMNTSNDPLCLLKRDAFVHANQIGQNMMKFQSKLTDEERPHFAKLMSFGNIIEINRNNDYNGIKHFVPNKDESVTIVELVNGNKLSHHFLLTKPYNCGKLMSQNQGFVEKLIDDLRVIFTSLKKYGFAHRDIHPDQFVFDLQQKTLVLIDFKCFQFYGDSDRALIIKTQISNLINYITADICPKLTMDSRSVLKIAKFYQYQKRITQEIIDIMTKKYVLKQDENHFDLPTFIPLTDPA